MPNVNIENDTKQLFVVLGMHRSGTSALAKALEVLGLSLGNELLPAGPGNDKGVWEDLKIVQINDRVLSLSNLKWDSIIVFPEELLTRDECKLIIDEAADLITARLETHINWGFKDPRTARLLPFWKQVFKKVGVKPNYIVSIRNPLEVALSLKARDNIELVKGQLLWLLHTLPNLELLEYERYIFINFAQILENPVLKLNQLAEYFSLSIKKNLAESYSNSFIDKNMRHHVKDLSKIEPSGELLPLVIEVYEMLAGLELNEYSISEMLEGNRYKDTVSEFNITLSIWQSEFLKREASIANDRKKLESKIEVLNQEVQHLNASLELSESFLKDLEHKNELMLRSTSWRITAPLRAIVSLLGVSRFRDSGKPGVVYTQIIRLDLIRRLSLRYIALNGGGLKGLRTLLNRVFILLKQFGFGGLKSQAQLYAKFSGELKSVEENDIWRSRSAEKANPVTMQKNIPCLVRQESETIDIVVCVHNALEDVKRCLKSVLEHSLPNYRIIIVDDGSDDATKEYLEHFSKVQGAILLRNDVANGYTLAANKGLRKSDAKYVILLNSDTIVTPHWLERMVSCANSDPKIGLVGPLSNTASWQSVPQIFDEDGDWAENTLPDGISVKDMGLMIARYSGVSYPSIHFLNGFCILIKREVLQSIGYFDEQTFARGYGEENDYCIRARKAGWQLALADDTYVYHAQSKSYSHERRQKLAEAAGIALAKKHGSEVIATGVDFCRNSLAIRSVRAKVKAMLENEKLITEGNLLWEGKRIGIFLPVTEVGGGANVVISEAIALQKIGIQVDILNHERYKEPFESSYADLPLRTRYFNSLKSFATIENQYDAVIATANTSVEWLEALSESPNTPVLGYYIQDYEPNFYERGSIGYKKAVNSYSAIKGMKLFTKTAWNAELLENETGKKAHIIGASVAYDLFSPCDNDEFEPVKIVAMIRPSTPRRAPENTMRLLQQVYQKYGDSINITLFGEHADHPIFSQYALKANVVGRLSIQGIAEVMSTADIFVDLSTFQAMGLTAMEAMASGTAVIVPVNGGATAYAINNENALVINTLNHNECYDALCKLISDRNLRIKFQRAGIESISKFGSVQCAFKIADFLFGRK